MKLLMRTFLFASLLLGALTTFGYFFWYKPKFNAGPASFVPRPAEKSNNALLVKLKTRAASAKSFVKQKGFSRQYCFLIDMSLKSGENRFFVYDMESDEIFKEGLVTHGGGGNSTDDSISFSNQPNSYCTSLGKYKVAESYYGRFGLAYKLHGLESTNSNAFKRAVVLHAHSCVPDEEVTPLSICTSLGCPTVSPAFLQELKTIITKADKPVLLWIYR